MEAASSSPAGSIRRMGTSNSHREMAGNPGRGLWLVLGEGIGVLSKPHSVRMKRLTLSHSRSNQKFLTGFVFITLFL